MSPNQTSVWKVKTTQICRELPLLNLEHLEKLLSQIGHQFEKLLPFEFLERFRCSISSVSISYAPESDLRVKSYEHLNFLRASVVQFRESRYIMSPNRTSVRKLMSIRICQELPLFNFEHLDILCPQIEHPCEKLWPFEFLERFLCSISSVSIDYVPESDICVKSYDHSNFSKASAVQFRASLYSMSTNRTSERIVMTIRISRELSLNNFERLHELCPRIDHPCEKSWPFEFSGAPAVQFRASWYIMSPKRTSVRKFMTIWISRELLLFNFEGLDILCSRIGHPGEKLWPVEFL